MSYTVRQLHKYSVDLYKRLPAETGQDVSFHVTGNLRLATCRERMDEYQKYCGTANTIGVPFQIIGPKQVKELWPLVELGDGAATANIVGALYHPDRKSTRLNSSHQIISYAVFCLKKKNTDFVTSGRLTFSTPLLA